MAKVSFSVEGEFITNTIRTTARECIFCEESAFNRLPCLNKLVNPNIPDEILNDIILGNKKFTGVNDLKLVDDSTEWPEHFTLEFLRDLAGMEDTNDGCTPDYVRKYIRRYIGQGNPTRDDDCFISPQGYVFNTTQYGHSYDWEPVMWLYKYLFKGKINEDKEVTNEFDFMTATGFLEISSANFLSGKPRIKAGYGFKLTEDQEKVILELVEERPHYDTMSGQMDKVMVTRNDAIQAIQEQNEDFKVMNK